MSRAVRVDVTEHPTLPRAQADEVVALVSAAEQHDGIAAVGEQALLDLAGATAVRHLTARAASGRLLGYAWVGTARAGELVVHPSARRQGTGRALVAALTAATAAPGTGTPDAGRPALWAHGDLPAARGLAAATGLTAVRTLWRMSLDLTGRPAGAGGAARDGGSVDLPAGVAVRAFVPGQDEDAWLAVNAAAFAWHPEQGRTTRADLDARLREPWFDPAGLLLAERDGTLVGFAWLKVEPGSADGELYVLGVAPSAQGTGLGRALTALALDRLALAGSVRAVLYTEADNTAAVATYRRAGFEVDRADVQYAAPTGPAPDTV